MLEGKKMTGHDALAEPKGCNTIGVVSFAFGLLGGTGSSIVIKVLYTVSGVREDERGAAAAAVVAAGHGGWSVRIGEGVGAREALTRSVACALVAVISAAADRRGQHGLRVPF